MDIVVRRAEVDDAAAMGEIHVAAWRWAYHEVMPAEFLAGLDPRRSAQGWRDALAETERTVSADGDPRPTAWVGERDGRVEAMGVAGVNRTRHEAEDPTGELWMLNSHPDAFGSGVATAVHATAVAHLAAEGHRDAILWVVEQNPRARRFYEREGWSADGGSRVETIGGAEVTELRYRRRCG